MTTSTSRLERSYRRLLRSYPAPWRRHHEDEVVAVLLDQAEAEGRTAVTAGAALDLVGHGLEERLEGPLRRLPTRLRQQVAAVSLVAAAGLSLILLVAEMIGARFLHADPSAGAGYYFSSGPFLTVGVGMYLAYLTAALLVVRGNGGLARLLVLAAVAFTCWLGWQLLSGGYPAPRVSVLVLLAGLGLLAVLDGLRPGRQPGRALVTYGTGFVAAVVVGVLLSRLVLGWSVGTMATSGNVALAALAVVLPVVGGVALLTAALLSHRHPGWPAALAVAALPVVLFCALVSQSVNPAHAQGRALFPLYYVLVVVAVALAHHRRRRRLARGA